MTNLSTFKIMGQSVYYTYRGRYDSEIANAAGFDHRRCVRLAGKSEDVFVPADVSGETLVEVVEGLLTLG